MITRAAALLCAVVASAAFAQDACKVPTDCKGALPEIARRCPGGGVEHMAWDCKAGKCEMAGQCAPAATTCTADTDCHGTIPFIAKRCDNGDVEHFSWKCEAGSCAIKGLCNETLTPKPNACTTAADCHGALSHLERACGDGTFGHNLWACRAGACETISSCEERGHILTPPRHTLQRP